MRHNYRMGLQYDGTRFNGWQRQGNTTVTIQGIVEEQLSDYVKENVDVKASGRTDKGVHALCQIVNFHSAKELEPNAVKEWLNHKLPADIRVLYAEEVPLAFHSRKSAVRKTYEYCIWNSQRKNIFYNRYAYTVEEPLNLKEMERAAALLCGTHDFRGFSSLKDSKKSTIRTIENITFDKKNEMLVIQFTGNGFLYHMVRILTGTLLEVGMGTRKADSIRDIFNNRVR